jgi:hypothetical protein
VKEEIADGVIGHNDIRPTVAVDVAHDRAQGFSRGLAQAAGYLNAGLGTDVLEFAITQVAIQKAVGSRKGIRRTVGAVASFCGE